ncbi:MAG: prephenate dehydrogenase [Ruminococcaceae bacterium]|nr:prephenate dehydrogenase [Oscillospiraceae bacterium]
MTSRSPITVGIVGLGLIGGSMARSFAAAGHSVLASDALPATLSRAIADGVVRDGLTEKTVAHCDLLLLAVYPQAAIEALRRFAPYISQNAVVLDLCGTKRDVCRACFEIAAEAGFTFVGGHPMAGTQFSGYENSRVGLFEGAPMVLVLPPDADPSLRARVETLLAPIGFGSFAVTSAEAHDRVIAFTSQLAHVVSNAYVKSPMAQIHHGFSAGSYRDLTRVAWLNEKMWCELFLENRDFLSEEIGHIITALSAYKTALDKNDAKTLEALLREGRLAKEAADKNGDDIS